ncbi:ArsR family transcriptional regulator [Rhodopirellula sp. JC740]|uniref:ArsR family transcriptional regulator n=1 Tax=Rhodopirellula halodulae TaxID=2894198 RepID=A0ABS8NE57_9BACT|nr:MULTISPECIES: ArsR family transcriptional regulator [unclassified Rhodopirellula]MCC9641837.1 ArsR family transcriptional regulator [Rhodopirellula sp. JC740]MCC9654828.1 ArsR family transcriptional regulator [Rhodopirellula sp. JC737]
MPTSSSTTESNTKASVEATVVMNSRPQTAANSAVVRSVDRELLQCLRSGESKAIGDLTQQLGVTATAVRQRVERLLEVGLIAREKVVAGRGRPTYRYVLTPAGYRRAGADATELAEAMWAEIVAMADGETRENLISAIASRLGRQFAAALREGSNREPSTASGESTTSDPATEEVRADETEAVAHSATCSCHQSTDSESFHLRMQRLTSMLQNKEISASLIEPDSDEDGVLPVLDIEACPFPSLTAAAGDRSMCRLEEQMLSEALGEDVHLSSCRLDGDSCCQFTTKSDLESEASTKPDSSKTDSA